MMGVTLGSRRKVNRPQLVLPRLDKNTMPMSKTRLACVKIFKALRKRQTLQKSNSMPKMRTLHRPRICYEPLRGKMASGRMAFLMGCQPC